LLTSVRRHPRTSPPFPTRRSSDLSLAHNLGPIADHRLRVVLAFVTLGNEAGEIVADHFVVATAEHFFSGRIHRTNDTAFVESDQDRKSTRLNSSHRTISYAVFRLK